MVFTSNIEESCRPDNASTTVTTQGAGIAQNLYPDAGIKKPVKKRISILIIGFVFNVVSGIFAIASFQRSPAVFNFSIALFSILAGAGFVYLVVKAILATEYDFEL